MQLAGQCHCTSLANACPVAEAQAKALEKTDRGVLGAFLAPAPKKIKKKHTFFCSLEEGHF